jgi:hypothetical protein
MIQYEMPDDVRAYVLLIQAELKSKKGNGKFSLQLTLNHIIRDHKKNTLLNQKKNEPNAKVN